jgi:DNA (cytosine-5)-methyltransferase 1
LDKPEGLSGYLTVSEAAHYLGVSPSTLRNWDRNGKLRSARHPMNRYRLYKREDLDAVLEQVSLREPGTGQERKLDE